LKKPYKVINKRGRSLQKFAVHVLVMKLGHEDEISPIDGTHNPHLGLTADKKVKEGNV
jgi:hypothetical protein